MRQKPSGNPQCRRTYEKQMDLFAHDWCGAAVGACGLGARRVQRQHVVTVGASVNGSYGQITYSEPRFGGGNDYLGSVARDVYSITSSLKTELNNQVREMAAREQINFTSGNLYGDANVTLQPNGAGYLTTRLSGLTYVGTASGTKRIGFLSGTCTVTVRVANIVATAQIGSATGGIPDESVGLTADVSSNANCSNSLQWVPLLGLVINIWAEHEVTGLIDGAARGAIATMKNKLFFERDANAYAGLNRIVPADKVIPLPNGQSFAVGQWLHGQLAWILNNVSANIVLGRGVVLGIVPGSTTPDSLLTGDVIKFNLVVGGVTLNIHLRQEVIVVWQWRCTRTPCPAIPDRRSAAVARLRGPRSATTAPACSPSGTVPTHVRR